MKPLRAWLGHLAMAGSCLAWAGCGGGGVPDPDSDSSAAAEPATRVVDQGGAAAPAEAPAAAEPAPAAEAQPPARESAIAKAPAPAAEAPAEPAAPATKGDASGTDDLLRMAATPAPAAPAPAPASPPAPGSGTPPMSSGEAAMAPGSGSGSGGSAEAMMPAPARRTFSSGNPTGGSGGPEAAANAAGGNSGSGMGRIDDSSSGMPGGPGGDLGNVAAMGGAAYRYPMTAASAFLAAVKSKNKDRIAQATARRSATEAEEKHRKIFAAIVEQSISDEEVDEIAKTLEGFQVVQQLEAKSTGRIGVLVAKQSGRDILRRTLMLRKEKEGWKVMDIGDMIDFKPSMIPTGRGRRR